jgi:hypothetical protein
MLLLMLHAIDQTTCNHEKIRVSMMGLQQAPWKASLRYVHESLVSIIRCAPRGKLHHLCSTLSAKAAGMHVS